MKKSNLVLIGTGLLYLIFISAIPVTLRYKLRHGEFILLDGNENYPYTRHTFENTNRIILEGLVNCTIVPSDSLFLEIENRKSNTITFHRHADSLTVKDSQAPHGIPQKIRIYLPTNGKVISRGSQILLWGTAGRKGKMSYQFELTESKLFTEASTASPGMPQSFHELAVTGHENSILDLRGIIWMDKLTLSNVSRFSYGTGFGSSNITTTYHGKALVESVRDEKGEGIVTSK